MKLTIAYFTARQDPMIEWFFRSLRRECADSGDEINVKVIDYHAKEPGRRGVISQKFADSFADEKNKPVLHHLPPKPCIWQGPYRLTKNEYFAASNARNTALALCQTDFIACVDDLSVLAPGWLAQVRHAYQHGYVALGAYKKVLNLGVDEAGNIRMNENPPGVDSRWKSGADGIVPAAGSWFFGCSFAMPIEAALRVNGFDEICDGQGAEDYDFGIRVDRAGYKFFYNRNMLTYESEELHHVPGNKPFIRMSKQMHFDGVDIGSDHVLLRRVLREPRVNTLSNQYDLRELRRRMLNGSEFPIHKNPQHDWRDGQPLAEM